MSIGRDYNKLIEKTCPICNKKFYAACNKKFCSRNCMNLSRRINTIEICKICGKEFIKKHNNKTCSKDCSLKLKILNGKIFYTNNKKDIFERNKLYYKLDSKRYKEYRKKYYEKNKNNKKEKTQKDIIKKRISSSIRSCLIKKKKTSQYLNEFGYSLLELEEHLLNTYYKNYNIKIKNINEKIHIDHIKPINSFVFFNKDGSINLEEIKKCWSLDNLQLLNASDNCSKYTKLNWDKQKYINN